LMMESHLVSGRQDLTPGGRLTYGQSITDPCLGWEDTTLLLEEIAGQVRARREQVPA
ncbi:MAG TPA: 3-deoxy-7-phosphoheptulonate synthase, partial [Gammaproteobacteria bacterium]|nr:3-deoxy-7-phosphoheptulonate synthase [Gammaproteobacteria bacterium]